MTITQAGVLRQAGRRGARRYLAVLLAALLVFLVASPRGASFDTPSARTPAVTEVVHDMQPAGAGTVVCDIFLFGSCTIVNTISSWAGDTIAGVGSDLLTSIVDAMCTATENAAFAMYTWWLYWPSINIESMGLGSYYDWMYGIGMIIAIMLLMSQALKTIVSRKGTPLLHAFMGIGKMAIFATAGLGLIDSLLKASDALTNDLALNFILGNLTQNPAKAFAQLITPQTQIGTMAAALLAIPAFFASILMLLMLIVRQAAIPIQAMLVPVAAAGQIGDGATREWHNRLWTSILATICYKPLAMLIVVIGFTEVNSSATAGSVKNDIYNVVVGMVTLILAVIAMPALMRLFAPVVSTATGGGGLSSALPLIPGLLRGGGGGGGGGDGGGPTSPAQLVQQGASQLGGGEGGQGAAESKPSGVTSAAANSSGTESSVGTAAAQAGAETAGTQAAGTAAAAATTGATAAASAAAPPVAVLKVAKMATDAAKNAAVQGINDAADGGSQ